MNAPQPKAPQSQAEAKPPFDAGDETQVKDRESRAKARANKVKNGLKLVLAHPDSRAWLWGILDESAPFAEPFTGNSTTFYNCGRSSLGRKLINQLLIDFPDEYFTMVKEAKNGA